MVSKRTEKILALATTISAIVGLSLPDKPSIFFLWGSVVCGGLYLSSSPKPWEQQQRWQRKVSMLRTQLYRCRYSESVEVLRSRIITLESQAANILENARAVAAIELEEARTRLKASEVKVTSELEKLEESKQHLSFEVRDLEQLSSEIARDAERKAMLLALKIKQDAEAEAVAIVANTKASLQNTVYLPEQAAHAEALNQINLSKEQAIAEMERLQSLQEKTRAAIEKMKVTAQAEYSKIKENLKKQAQAQFLKDMERTQEVLSIAENQVNLLSTENQMLRSELAALDEPQYPEGWTGSEIYARGIIDFYKELGIKLDYKLSLRDGDRVKVRVIPREAKVGEAQLRKFSDRLQRKFELSELPAIITTAGTIQIELKLTEIQNPVIETYAAPALAYNRPVLHPELVSVEEMRSHLRTVEQREFIPPPHRFSPFEPLTTTEKDWVLWLWQVCRIQDQELTIKTVWQNTRGRGVTKGIGQSYAAAREKLHKILDEAGIPRRQYE